jgi:hypothetical protein
MRRACMALFLCFAVAFGLAAPAAYAAPVVIPPDAAPTKTGNTYAAWSAVWRRGVSSSGRLLGCVGVVLQRGTVGARVRCREGSNRSRR